VAQAQPLTAEAVDSVLAAVLAGVEFAPAGTSPLIRLLAAVGTRIRDAVAALVRRFAPDLDLSGVELGWLGRALQPAAIVAGVLVLGYLLYIAIRAVRARERRRSAAERPGPTQPVTAAEWEAAARAAAAAGRWREAAVALYQSVLRRLAQQGALRFDPARTPGEYRRELRSHPRLGEPVDRFIGVFERAAFGRGAAGAREYEALCALAVEVSERG
jgi:hypothetical protein